MGKVIGTIGVVVAAVALTATGIGAIAAPALAGAVTIGGVSASTLLLAGTALQAVGRVLTKQPKPSSSTTERLNASLVTDTPRKMVFGRTAMNTDLRYQEWWGRDQEYCSQVFVLASHHCTSIDEIWLDDKLAWSADRGVIGEFVGYLAVQSYAQATAGSVFNAGWSRRWGAQSTFSGCATLYLQFKVTGNGKKGKSPFTSSITSRLSVVGKGAPMPDPRFDSTAGGSGALRVADKTTWSWAPQGYEAGRNPALALLFYLIGWRIRNPSTGEWKLAVGRGVPIDRINLDSFITAANLCDEPVTRANGTSEPRYRCDGTFSEGDDPSQVIANLETCMNAKLRDSAGRFSLQVLHNDLATPLLDFTDDDVLGDFSWTAGNDLNDRRNVVRGRYTDPSALYQLADFPQIKLPALDGIDRIESLDLALVQSPGQAQRLAKQRVQRQQYEGEFRASFNARGWAVKDGDIVRLTFSALGFDKKLFRVSEGLIDPTGSVPLVLGEEHPSIYAWDREESPAVQAAVPNAFNPLLLPIIAAIDDAGQTADWPAIVGEGKPDDYATNSGDPDSPFGPGTVAMALATLDQIEPITLAVSDIKRASIDQSALIRQADRDRAQLAAAQIAGLLDQQVTRITLRDAGLITDPESGRVYIYAIEQNAQKVSKVEIGLDAVTNEIALRATYNDVATMITQAQLSPGDAAELGELVRRVNVAEISISGMTAAIALKADAITVTKLGGIVQSVSQTLDALAGEVTTKVSYSDFTPVRDRVGTVEQLLQSYGDVSTYQLTLRQAELRGTAAAAAGIASLVSNADTAQRLIVRSAEIQQSLTVRMDEGDAAEAASRLALAAKVGANEAGLVEERQTRVDAVSAQVKRTDLLTAIVVDQGATFDARFISQAKAISDGDKAQADRTDILTATVTKLGQDITATFAQQAKAISDGDSASATALTQLTARIGDFGLVSVQQAFSVLADRTGKLEGQYTLSIDTNGRLQGFKLAGSASGPATFSFIDTDLNMGAGRVIFNNGVVMQVQGLGFGKNNDLLSWYGPSMSVTQCTKSNGLEWKDVSGNLYTSGSIKAGPYTNSGTGTLIAADASFTLGPFTSSGGAKTVVASYNFRRTRTVAPGGGGAITGTPSATIALELQGANGAWSQVQTLQTGQPFVSATPATGQDPGRLEEAMSASVTWTDNRTMIEGYVYRLRITARTLASFSGTASSADSVVQSLSILSQE